MIKTIFDLFKNIFSKFKENQEKKYYQRKTNHHINVNIPIVSLILYEYILMVLLFLLLVNIQSKCAMIMSSN